MSPLVIRSQLFLQAREVSYCKSFQENELLQTRGIGTMGARGALAPLLKKKKTRPLLLAPLL